jgi:hypothetical protein
MVSFFAGLAGGPGGAAGTAAAAGAGAAGFAAGGGWVAQPAAKMPAHASSIDNLCFFGDMDLPPSVERTSVIFQCSPALFSFMTDRKTLLVRTLKNGDQLLIHAKKRYLFIDLSQKTTHNQKFLESNIDATMSRQDY